MLCKRDSKSLATGRFNLEDGSNDGKDQTGRPERRALQRERGKAAVEKSAARTVASPGTRKTSAGTQKWR
jgi:hypothetical protein